MQNGMISSRANCTAAPHGAALQAKYCALTGRAFWRRLWPKAAANVTANFTGIIMMRSPETMAMRCNRQPFTHGPSLRLQKSRPSGTAQNLIRLSPCFNIQHRHPKGPYIEECHATNSASALESSFLRGVSRKLMAERRDVLARVVLIRCPRRIHLLSRGVV